MRGLALVDVLDSKGHRLGSVLRCIYPTNGKTLMVLYKGTFRIASKTGDAGLYVLKLYPGETATSDTRKTETLPLNPWSLLKER